MKASSNQFSPKELQSSLEVESLKEAIVDLYLAIKIRSADEVSPEIMITRL